MSFHRCAICLEDGSILIESVHVALEGADQTGASSWYGTVTGTEVTTLAPGLRYVLKLDDGRSGEFIVRRNTRAGEVERAVSIRGMGPLK